MIVATTRAKRFHATVTGMDIHLPAPEQFTDDDGAVDWRGYVESVERVFDLMREPVEPIASADLISQLETGANAYASAGEADRAAVLHEAAQALTRLERERTRLVGWVEVRERMARNFGRVVEERDALAIQLEEKA